MPMHRNFFHLILEYRFQISVPSHVNKYSVVHLTLHVKLAYIVKNPNLYTKILINLSYLYFIPLLFHSFILHFIVNFKLDGRD